jgi:predicted ribosome quality control (RQC) complex YloA/Tae2 family protein
MYDTLCQAMAGNFFTPTVITGINGPQDYFPFHPQAADGTINFPTMDEALDFFYARKMSQNRLESMRSNMLRNIKGHLDKAYKKLYFQESDLAQAQKSEIYRSWGELLTAYNHQVHKGQSSVVLPNFDGDGTTTIELLPHLGPVENARRYFKRYTKAKKTRESLERFIDNNKQEISYLESVAIALEKAESLAEIEDIVDELDEQGFTRHRAHRPRQRQSRSQPRHFLSSDGIDIQVGRNNRQTDPAQFRQERPVDARTGLRRHACYPIAARAYQKH